MEPTEAGSETKALGPVVQIDDGKNSGAPNGSRADWLEARSSNPERIRAWDS